MRLPEIDVNAYMQMAQDLEKGSDADESAALESSDQSALLDRLAKLPSIDYDRLRQASAEQLGIRVSTLDNEVEKLRPRQEAARTDGGRMLLVTDPEVWPETVDGAAFADTVLAELRRYVVVAEPAAVAVTLWVFLTWSLDAARIATRLLVRSPIKGCGKTTLMNLLTMLTRRPLSSSNVTPAALFRSIEQWSPTVLVDEADTFLGASDELRGLLNSGHSRTSAFVVRTTGENHEPAVFSTWAAVAIAMIRTRLHDTLIDRSIVIEMLRKGAAEKVEQLPLEPAAFDSLRRKLARWGRDNVRCLKSANPAMPEGFYNRMADNWSPLLAIADRLGGRWPEMARSAAVALTRTRDDDGEAAGALLLQDLHGLFAERGEKMFSSEIVRELAEREDRPWPEWKDGKRISVRQLAALVRSFSVVPKTIRIGQTTAKGYSVDQFEDAFSRYIPPQNVTPSQVNTGASSSDSEKRNIAEPVTDQEQWKPTTGKGCDVVTDEIAESSGKGEWEGEL